MLPPAEQVGILNRRGVDKPGVWRESLNFPAHQSRLGEETTRGELATPEATHVQPRNNFHLMPAVSETGQHVGDEHATPRGVFFTAGTTLKVGCTGNIVSDSHDVSLPSYSLTQNHALFRRFAVHPGLPDELTGRTGEI